MPMKTTNLLLPISLASAMIAGPCREVRARDGVEHVVFNEGQVWAIQGGTADLLKKDLELPHNILVNTISLQKGKVVVQKEGTQIVVGFGRSIMMNEGTKVFGDGTVISRDGTTTLLTEGQIITIQGVVKLR